MIALIAAAGETAYAAKSITYKTLDRTPVTRSADQQDQGDVECDPDDCYLDTATSPEAVGVPRRAVIVVDGTFSTDGTGARGSAAWWLTMPYACQQRVRQTGDNTGVHVAISTPVGAEHDHPLGGIRTPSVQRQETDIKFHDIQIGDRDRGCPARRNSSRTGGFRASVLVPAQRQR
jgi:hypothetical protein